MPEVSYEQLVAVEQLMMRMGDADHRIGQEWPDSNRARMWARNHEPEIDGAVG